VLIAYNEVRSKYPIVFGSVNTIIMSLPRAHDTGKARHVSSLSILFPRSIYCFFELTLSALFQLARSLVGPILFSTNFELCSRNHLRWSNDGEKRSFAHMCAVSIEINSRNEQQRSN
jgi:hypothetical protein